MHENNIALLCHEAERLLQLNIQLLQKMVDAPDVLLDSTQNDDNLLFDKIRARQRIEELQGEQTKIARKEMVLAVVGTMKAGKSTTINAIVGKEILPNRNRPMTSIPTLIRHVPGKTTPDLQLNNIEPISQLIVTLKKEIGTPEGKARVVELQKDQEKSKLLAIITDTTWVKTKYVADKEIYQCLASLNDLVRLAAALNVPFPFEAYEEVHELPVIEVEFSHLTGMEESLGTLTLLDTPGPNEAGQPHLQAMMRDQLQKASAVLAVLDYTQLSSNADHLVRQELNEIASVTAGRLFVLVNKFDQNDRNSDDAETVIQSVPALLQSGTLNSDRVYPCSSRNAFLANCACRVVSEGGQLSIQEKWVEDYARLAFGYNWKKDVEDAEKVRQSAESIWEDSRFDTLITQVIKAAHSKAAALAVDSAAAKLVQNGEDTSEYLSVRHQGLKTSTQALKTQIDGLMSDIDNIATCQKEVTGEVERAMGGISQKTDALLKETQENLESAMSAYFKSGKKAEKEEFKALQNARRSTGFLSKLGVTKPTRGQDFDPNELEMKFTDREKAEAFVRQIEDSVTELLAETEKNIKPTLVTIVSGIEKSFQSTAVQATDKIAKQINSRLEDDGFTVNIKFPDAKQLQTNLSIKTRMTSLLEEKSFRETRSRRKTNAWGKLCKLFNTGDWGWEDYSVNVTRSVVDIRKIEKVVREQTKNHFAELNQAIDTDINQPIANEIKSFFDSFKTKVEQLRNTLIQSTKDHQNDKMKQEKLTERLQALKQETPDMLRDSKALKEELEPML